VTTPYTPFAPSQAGLAVFYTSTVQVLRLTETLQAGGGMTMSWQPVTTIVDPLTSVVGQLRCRIDLTHLRPGKDLPSPMVAGRAPDRVGVMYFSLSPDANGAPQVLAADRVRCVAGPIFGTFEVRLIPDVAQDLTGAHHAEVQVIEVSQQLGTGSPTPFPGSQP
jgi:hypothetical protein